MTTITVYRNPEDAGFFIDTESTGVARLSYKKNRAMSPLMAFEISINKWNIIMHMHKNLPNRVIRGNGASTCGLCHFFPDMACTGCPVKAHTGLPNCLESPYQEWNEDRTYENAK